MQLTPTLRDHTWMQGNINVILDNRFEKHELKLEPRCVIYDAVIYIDN